MSMSLSKAAEEGSPQQWSPLDCLAVAATTASGLLQRTSTEVELLVVAGIELRAGVSGEPMVPLTTATAAAATATTKKDFDAKNEANLPITSVVDTTKRASQWVDRSTDLQVTVTTHRLVFFRDRVSQVREARYLHLSSVFNVEAETAYFKSPKIVLYTALGDLVLVFPTAKGATKQQRDDCLQQLNLSLGRKQWDVEDEQQRQTERQKLNRSHRKVGVDAVLSASQNRHQQAAHLTDTAFAGDAETLLKEATELVQIIHKYVATLDRETVDSSNSNNNDNSSSKADTDRLVSLLQDMGMTSALKKADYKGGTAAAAYYDQTARQLADFVRPKLAVVPVLTLTDVYCLFNRARGSHLLSPEDLLTALEHLQTLNLGFSVVTFPDSGLKVLQDDSRTNDKIRAETFLNICRQHEGYVTALTVSKECRISAVLATEQLLAAERAEYLVRDETMEAIRFYPNRFVDFVMAPLLS